MSYAKHEVVRNALRPSTAMDNTISQRSQLILEICTFCSHISCVVDTNLLIRTEINKKLAFPEQSLLKSYDGEVTTFHI